MANYKVSIVYDDGSTEHITLQGCKDKQTARKKANRYMIDSHHSGKVKYIEKIKK